MAIDTLSAVSFGVLSASGTNQAGINNRFGSWGLLTDAPEPSLVTLAAKHLGRWNPFRRIYNAMTRMLT